MDWFVGLLAEANLGMVEQLPIKELVVCPGHLLEPRDLAQNLSMAP